MGWFRLTYWDWMRFQAKSLQAKTPESLLWVQKNFPRMPRDASGSVIGQHVFSRRQIWEFQASRGLSRRGKNERKERDLCRLPTRLLSRMCGRFLNNQWRFSHVRHNPQIRFARETPAEGAVCGLNQVVTRSKSPLLAEVSNDEAKMRERRESLAPRVES